MKKIIGLVFCFFLAGTGTTFAQMYGPGGVLNRHNFEIAPEISYRIYDEPGVSREEGMMYGVVLSYAYHNRIMVKGEFIGNGGTVDYSNSGKIDDIPDYMLEFRGVAGYDFLVSRNWMITPYVGFAYRYLSDNGSGKVSTEGAAAYDRESNYLYSPIGVEIVTHLGNRWSLTGTGEFDIFIWGKQISHLSDVRGYSDIENEQKEGYGLRGSIMLAKKFSRVSFEAGPFVRYWNVRESDPDNIYFNGRFIGVGYEPKNNSTEFGVKLGVRF